MILNRKSKLKNLNFTPTIAFALLTKAFISVTVDRRDRPEVERETGGERPWRSPRQSEESGPWRPSWSREERSRDSGPGELNEYLPFLSEAEMKILNGTIQDENNMTLTFLRFHFT